MRTFVIYTTEVGGTYRVSRASRKEYDEAVKTGRWLEWEPPHFVDLKMIGFLDCDEYHDFVRDQTFEPFIL